MCTSAMFGGYNYIQKERILNWSTAILLFLAWQLLSKNSQSSPKLQDIAPFLNEDTRGILDGVAKLSSTTATTEDKTGAIFQMMTNPTVMSFAQNLFGGKGEQPSTTPPTTTTEPTTQTAPFAWETPPDTSTPPTDTTLQTPSFATTPPQNDEGYTFDSPSERAKQFFAPIDPIATAEVKHKLCYFYDHWYLAK